LRNFRGVRQFNTRNMKREDDQELWDLLGKASEPTVSPFFARNVLRQVRQERGWRDRLSDWLAPRRLVPAAAVALAITAAAVSMQQPTTTPTASEPVPEVIAQLDEIDYQVVADLDALLAMEEDSLWTDGETLTL
jgi:hypothetical protein